MARVKDRARYEAAEAAMWASHGVDVTEHRVTVPGGGKVRALSTGAGHDVVFVHGTPSAGGMFAPLVGALRGVRSIVVDRPGCGSSDVMAGDLSRPETLRAAASGFLAAVIEDLATAPVDLVASSAGAMPALLLAGNRPDLVRSVVLEGAPAVRGMRLPWHMRVATVGAVSSAVSRFPVGEREIRKSLGSIGHGATVKRGGLSAEDFAWRVALARDTDTYANDLELLRSVAGWSGIRAGWGVGRADVARLQAPSLWVLGSADPFAREAEFRRWAAAAPVSEVRVREGEGHMPWIDAPEEHARMLERWWATVPVVIGGARPTVRESVA